MLAHTPVEGGEVHNWVTLLELPGLDLLAGPVCAELHLDGARAQVRGGSARCLVAHLIAFYAPRLCKLVHVELEDAVAANGVVPLVAIVVPAKAAQATSQVGCGYHLHKAVSIPGDLQPCGKDREIEGEKNKVREVALFLIQLTYTNTQHITYTERKYSRSSIRSHKLTC